MVITVVISSHVRVDDLVSDWDDLRPSLYTNTNVFPVKHKTNTSSKRPIDNAMPPPPLRPWQRTLNKNELANDINNKNVFVSHSVHDIDDLNHSVNDINVFVNHFVNDFVNDFANDFVNNFVNKPPKPLGDEIVKMSKFLTDNAMKLMELFSHSVENVKNRE